MDKKLYEKLYQTYYMKVYSFLVSQTKDTHLSEELTQETFVRAMTTKSGYQGGSKEFTWLCAIAKNLLTDEKRKNSRMSELPEEIPDAENIEALVADKDTALRVHMILHTLKEPYKEVFELRIFGELSFAQIGTIFQKTESWARVTFYRARLMIQERMAEK